MSRPPPPPSMPIAVQGIPEMEAPKGRPPLMSTSIDPHGKGGMPPPPPSAGPNVSGRDKVLLEMQKHVHRFYTNNCPEKLDNSVFALALQLWWDEGLVTLNAVLREKYGTSIDISKDFLDDFNRNGEDVTVTPNLDLKPQAGDTHPLFKTILRTNNGDFFHNNKAENERKFVQSVKLRQAGKSPRAPKTNTPSAEELKQEESDSESSEEEHKKRSKRHGKGRKKKHRHGKSKRKRRHRHSDDDSE